MLKRMPLALLSCAALTCSDGAPQIAESTRALATDPDLTIEYLDAPPSSLLPASFNIEVSVCNHGGGDAGSSVLEVRLSDDAIIDVTDQLLSSLPVPALTSGHCYTQEIPISIDASAAEGEHHLGATADATNVIVEDREDDNTRERSLGLGEGTQLFVRSLEFDPGPTGGYEVEICNFGTMYAAGHQLSVAISEDAIFDQGDGWTDNYVSVEPGECSWFFGAGPWPSSPGDVFYVIASLASDQAELVTSDDVFVSEPVLVGSGADLNVTNLIIDPPTLYELSLVTARVCNAGNQPSASVLMSLFASLLGPSTDFEDEIDGWRVPELEPGECFTAQNQLPSQPLTYFTLWADSLDELVDPITGNDVLSILDETEPLADLVVEAIVAAPTATDIIDAIVQVCNRGPIAAASSAVHLYASRDDRITGSVRDAGIVDILLGTAPVPFLDPYQCYSATIESPAPPTAGHYLLAAIADEAGTIADRDRINNTLARSRIAVNIVTPELPDLIVAGVAAPATHPGNASFPVTIDVCNTGPVTSLPSYVVALAATSERGVELWPRWQNYANLPSLAAGECTEVVIQVTPRHASGGIGGDGLYYLGGRVLVSAVEISAENNFRQEGSILLNPDPDLFDLAVQLEHAPASAPDSMFRWSVCNRGPIDSAWGDLFIASARSEAAASIAPWQTFYWWEGFHANVPALAPEACASGDVGAWALRNRFGMYVAMLETPYWFRDFNSLNDRSRPILAVPQNWVNRRLTGVAATPSGGSTQVVVTSCEPTEWPSSIAVNLYRTRPVPLPLAAIPSDAELVATAALPVHAPNECADTTITVPSPSDSREYVIVAALPDAIDYDFGGITRGAIAMSAPFSVSADICGDGAMNGTESCDDGNTTDNDGCSGDCLIEACGDGVVQSNEACDDGNTTNDDGCSATCALELCGDGVQQTSEGCDDGNTTNNDGCSSSCVIEACGDAIVQTSEGCDDGNTLGGDGCSATCVAERCGDGITNNVSETCDDGNTADNDGCSSACAIERCGDAIVQTSEGCDDGNTASNDGCSAGCFIEACGDAIVQTTEACDDGNTSNNDGCSSSCAIERCGDAIVQSSEGCDDGNTASNDGCSAGCLIEACGDAIVQTTEACDDGNTANNDGCSAACQLEQFCGDGAINSGEACDDGNTTSGDGCSASCAIEVCGDGVVNVAGETCDDGNTADGDGCGATCRVEVPQTPWATNEHGQLAQGDGYNYVLGYNFTPLVDGYVTALGARVNGTKSVRLFHRNTRQELARANVTTAYAWAFTNITPVRLTAGQTYIVAVYSNGTGGVFRSHVQLPLTYGNIRIDSGAFESTATDPNAFPYYYTFQALNGQADIRFTPLAR